MKREAEELPMEDVHELDENAYRVAYNEYLVPIQAIFSYFNLNFLCQKMKISFCQGVSNRL